MTLQFEPKTDEQLRSLIPDGEYNFSIATAEDYVSKTSGDEMIKMIAVVWDHNGAERTLTDYLTAKALFKIKHFCDAVGLEQQYKKGQLTAADCVNKIGKCIINTQKGTDGYPPKNSIKDYVKKVDIKSEEKFIDDEIPFG